MEPKTELEPEKKIYIDPATYKTLEYLANNKNMTMRQYTDLLFKRVTTFCPEPEHPDPSIEFPLTPEQYAKLRTWQDAKDNIEIATRGKSILVLLNSRIMWRNNHPGFDDREIGEPVQLNITVMSIFIDFIKEYTRFFGCKDTVEDFCMKAVYEKVQRLNGDLEKFAGTHGLHVSDWLARFNERTHGSDPETENDC